MAPKPSPAQRQALTLEYFRSSLTAHTLKDLEKALPSVSSVASIQVKDHVQALVDEGLVKVEKIGSGNWFWSFGGEERRARETTLGALKDEHARWETSIAGLREEVAAKETAMGGDGEARERAELQERVDELKGQVEKLKEELESYSDMDPQALDSKRAQTQKEKERATRWTENCWTVENWLKRSLGVDRESLDGLQRQCYGSEYVEGEGMPEC